jgi:hypothetical protein
MKEYQITCVGKSHRTTAGHQHIATVGISGETHPYTVPQIYTLMGKGFTFFTYSPSGHIRADVAKYTCCGVATLRSHADGKWDDNLDNLSTCV